VFISFMSPITGVAWWLVLSCSDVKVQSLAHTHVGSSPIAGPFFCPSSWLSPPFFFRLRSDTNLFALLCSIFLAWTSHPQEPAPFKAGHIRYKYSRCGQQNPHFLEVSPFDTISPVLCHHDVSKPTHRRLNFSCPPTPWYTRFPSHGPQLVLDYALLWPS
jgi:hypothetical protein